jgi:hypothetical protein
VGKLSPSRKRNNTRLKQILLDITTFVKPRIENRANKVGLREGHSSWNFRLRGFFTPDNLLHSQSFVPGLQKLTHLSCVLKPEKHILSFKTGRKLTVSIIIPSTLLGARPKRLQTEFFLYPNWATRERPAYTRSGKVSGTQLVELLLKGG